MFRYGYEYVKDSSYCPEGIGEDYILEAYIPQKYQLSGGNSGLHLSKRNEFRHAVGGVAAHTLRYFSENREGFNIFRARGEAVWWLRHVYNSFKWWRSYIVNAEGERKDMPMLYVGETFGAATSYDGKEADIVLSAFENDNGIIDPDDTGGTVFAVGYSERGGLFNSPDKYAVKTIVGSKYIGSGVDVTFPVHKNLRLMAEYSLKKGNKNINDINVQDEIKKIKVVILNRERHKRLAAEVKNIGAQLILVDEDDLSPAFALARGEVDFITGVGGIPEGVLSAMIVEKLGGKMTLRLLPDEVANSPKLLSKKANWDLFKMDEIEIFKNFHIVKPGTENGNEVPFNKVFTSKDLAKGRDMVFTASIIKKTPWIKDENGNEVPGVAIDPDTGELTVYTIRIVGKNVEIVPVIYITAINKFKQELKQDLSIEEHAHVHIQLAKVYAEFGLFKLADISIQKATHDQGVTEKLQTKYKRVVEYIKGLELLTKNESKTPELAVKHFEIASRLDVDNSDGLRPKRMIKRIYEYMGDKYYQSHEFKNAIKYFKRALKYGAHELKLYRKINSTDMKPLLLNYFNNVNNEYNKSKHHTTKEWDKIKLGIALDAYYEDFIHQAFIGGDPWLVFFRRTVMHNLGLSYKLALVMKLKLLLNELNNPADSRLSEYLSNEFGIDKEEINAIINFRTKRGKFLSVSELYLIQDIKIDTLVKLLVPDVKVYAHNELETADIPISISRVEAVERRYKNILQEIEESFKEEAQEHSYAVGEAYHYIGLALYDVGDFPGARIHYGKAIRKFREIIEKFVGITPVNAQYRIGNMFEELAVLFTDRKQYYSAKAMNEYKKIVDDRKAVKLFGSAYKLNTARIEQATDKVSELEAVIG
ncbi:MAG: fructose-bisphosphatase class II [Candidatus Anammoxibacter sp.]